jgi:hypothetical protein
MRQGYTQIGLVGCDSNYNQNSNADSNYFYDSAKHVSKETGLRGPKLHIWAFVGTKGVQVMGLNAANTLQRYLLGT